MKRKLILNRRLENIENLEQNNLLTNKILKVKSTLNLNCPESYTFFKSKHFQNGHWKNICKNNNKYNILKYSEER